MPRARVTHPLGITLSQEVPQSFQLLMAGGSKCSRTSETSETKAKSSHLLPISLCDSRHTTIETPRHDGGCSKTRKQERPEYFLASASPRTRLMDIVQERRALPGHTLAGETARQNHTDGSLPLATLALLVWGRHLAFFWQITNLLYCILCV